MQNEARRRIPMKVRKAIGFHKETVISSSGDGIAQSLSSGVYKVCPYGISHLISREFGTVSMRFLMLFFPAYELELSFELQPLDSVNFTANFANFLVYSHSAVPRIPGCFFIFLLSLSCTHTHAHARAHLAGRSHSPPLCPLYGSNVRSCLSSLTIRTGTPGLFPFFFQRSMAHFVCKGERANPQWSNKFPFPIKRKGDNTSEKKSIHVTK